MKILRLLPLGLFALLLFFLGYGLALDPHKLPTPKIGKNVPAFDLPVLVGTRTQRFTPAIFQGHMSVLVVWASWCDSCRDEHAFLMTLAQQKGLNIYGLNYKDDPKDAKQWLTEWGNPFQAIALDRQGKLALDLGVYGTPETYLIDKKGKIQHRYAGLLTPEIWRKEFLPYMA